MALAMSRSHYALKASILLAVTLVFAAAGARGDEAINYDEGKVSPYTLPDPLVFQDGSQVADAEAWRSRRRGELLELFREHVYGRVPERPQRMRFELIESVPDALEGLATRKRIVVHFTRDQVERQLTIVCYVPNQRTEPAPVFVGLHLFPRDADYPVAGKHVVGKSRKDNQQAERVPASFGELPGEKIAETILRRGYAVATLDAKDFAPDDKDRYDEGVLSMFEPDRAQRGPDAGKAIAAWAWGLSRAMDYFETDPDFDPKRVIVVGHSRMGKTALWAGAQDERFAIVISNNSGCGGAALSKRDFGETVARINRVFPHWFCDNFRKYDDRESELPVDQHELIALVAPRPVYIASAADDAWADPRGEFLAAQGADPVYRLLGHQGLSADSPALNEPMGDRIGYHVRSGGHALADYDWLRYLDFADRHNAR